MGKVLRINLAKVAYLKFVAIDEVEGRFDNIVFNACSFESHPLVDGFVWLNAQNKHILWIFAVVIVTVQVWSRFKIQPYFHLVRVECLASTNHKRYSAPSIIIDVEHS